MKWLEEISRKIMHYIIVIAITTIMVLNCVFTARVAYDESEKVSYFVIFQRIFFDNYFQHYYLNNYVVVSFFLLNWNRIHFVDLTRSVH